MFWFSKDMFFLWWCFFGFPFSKKYTRFGLVDYGFKTIFCLVLSTFLGVLFDPM